MGKWLRRGKWLMAQRGGKWHKDDEREREKGGKHKDKNFPPEEN